jgi:hypothetical protein
VKATQVRGDRAVKGDPAEALRLRLPVGDGPPASVSLPRAHPMLIPSVCSAGRDGECSLSHSGCVSVHPAPV